MLVLTGVALGPPWPRRRAVLALAALGDASYSLYLVHPFVVRTAREVWRTWMPDAPIAFYALVASLAAVGAALLLHRWVDRPVTSRLRRWNQAGTGRLADAAERLAAP
jgi:exopolysaccharide production protein ExoZ